MGNTNRKRPVVQRCLAVLMLTALLAGVFSPASADAASRHKASSFKPTSKLIFNDPKGSKAQKNAIVNTVVQHINAAPPGATIMGAYYWVDLDAPTNALIAADKRGVHVKLVLDKRHVNNKAAKRLRKAFRHGGHSKSSVFFRTTDRLMHAKILLISKSGDAKRIAMWGSANLSKNNAAVNTNDWRIRVNSPNYGCLSTQFKQLNNHKIRDVKTGRTCVNKGMLTVVTPVGGASPWTVHGINRVNCTGGTKIRASFMQWSDVAVAKAFVRKQAQGCDVQLLVSRSSKKVPAKVFKALKAKTKHGRIKVYVAKPGHGIHYKFVVTKGKKQAWMMTGSLHPSKGSQHGVQLVVREDSTKLANSYLKQFEKLTASSRASRRS